MRYRVIVTARARRDMDIAAAWYGDHDPRAGRRWMNGIQQTIRSLAENPQRCGLAHESDELGIEVRELLYGSGRRKTHRIVFRIAGDAVEVLHVRHFAQDDLSPDDV